ncbi:MAG: molybdate ABC transporter substrate-binding protein [Pseudomonadota bacterium]
MRCLTKALSVAFVASASLITLGPARSAAADLTIFAAASTGTALAEVTQSWEDETGYEAVLSLAGTSALARQIAAGAPADVFLSANPEWMDTLEAASRIVPDSRYDLLGNSLVLIAPAGAPQIELTPPVDLRPHLSGGPLAMALVDAVPAGIYGQAALEALGAWSDVAPFVAQTDSVRAALALVAAGAAPLGLVYATDALAEPRVAVVARLPAATHPPIIYPVAAVAGGNTAQAEAFLIHLRGASARAAFARQGFAVLGD